MRRRAQRTKQFTVDNSRVFTNTADGVQFLLIVVEATEDKQAVAIPAYVSVTEEPQLREQGKAAGELTTQIRALGSESQVRFTHEDPTIFFSE